MAATVTPSKITDYFPPSPKPEDKEEEPEEGKLEDIESEAALKTEESDKPDASLLKSSVAITPKSSPAKEEEVSKTESTIVTELPVPESTCKKSLNSELKQEEVTKPAGKNKRRGRRKKNKGSKTDAQTDVTATSAPARPKTARKKNSSTDTTMKNTLVTDYFPVRRSERKSKSLIDKEKEEELQYKILNNCEDGLEVTDIPNKGRGVVATKDFLRGDFVVEYAGDLISIPEAKERDTKYSKDPTKGCYMYYFTFKGKSYCIDATEESGKLGRLLNHSKTSGNCHTKLVDVNNHPYLILAASRDIKSGEELQYDYGDRSKSALEAHPWLKS